MLTAAAPTDMLTAAAPTDKLTDAAPTGNITAVLYTEQITAEIKNTDEKTGAKNQQAACSLSITNPQVQNTTQST